jgi:transposase
MSKEITQRYLTPKQAAKFLGFSAGTLANWRNETEKTGKLVGPPFIPGGRIRYDILDLIEYMEKRKKRGN